MLCAVCVAQGADCLFKIVICRSKVGKLRGGWVQVRRGEQKERRHERMAAGVAPTMVVLAFPPSESCSRRVSLESR